MSTQAPGYGSGTRWGFFRDCLAFRSDENNKMVSTPSFTDSVLTLERRQQDWSELQRLQIIRKVLMFSV